MDFNAQMKWLDYQIKNLIATREAMGWEDFKGSDEEENLKALVSIKSDYLQAREKANNYSWQKHPDRMGK
jgi:hypothetical protein